MDFWNPELRVCPKCKAAVQMEGEPRTKCPKCGTQVWFFCFRALPPAPELPSPRGDALWNHPTTTLLLAATCIFGLVALIAVAKGGVVAAAAALAAMGFAIFGFVRHAEARQAEQSYEEAGRTVRYAETMRDRVKELTSRYNHLLATSDTRVEHYYRDIFRRAEKEREQAAVLRQEAERDRMAVRSVENRIYVMAERLLNDHLKWTVAKLRPDPENYQRRRNELDKAFAFVESIGYQAPAGLRKDTLARLRTDFERVMREHHAKQQQKRVNQQMREEEKVRREREAAIREAEQEEQELERRLAESLRVHRDAHSAEVDVLRRQLAEAQANAERAKSMAQLTKAGHVYILSNIGAFGEGVYKVGMTRRLEPQDRVKELGDASVPFPFDVHAMISCENAPALEHGLHLLLSRYRVNRVNLRKEFFKIDLETILEAVRRHHGEIDYVAEPEALEYRETLATTPEDVEQLEAVVVAAGYDFEESDE